MQKEIRPISPKLYPLYKPAPYKLFHGGRGSAKSWGIAEALVHYSSQIYSNQLRILCVREYQNSIKESAKKLIEDTINRLGIADQYTTTNHGIRNNKTGAEFLFEGLARNYNSIKSMENISICWVEEAQTISQQSLDVLLPTIRAQGSEIWFTWNRFLPTDPIEEFASNPPQGTVIQEMNYPDNPMFPDALKLQMEHMKATDVDKYNHIWMGGFIDQGDNKLISLKDVMQARERIPDHLDVPVFAGLDPARYGDDTACLYIRQGNKTLHIKEWAKCSVPELARWVGNYILEYNIKALGVDIGNLSGVFDLLTDPQSPETYINPTVCRVIEINAGGKSPDVHYFNKRSYLWGRVNSYIKEGGALPQNSQLVKELIQQEYYYNAKSQLQLITKEQMRKDGIKSPNIADALSFTFDPEMEPPNKPEPQRARGRRVWAG